MVENIKIEKEYVEKLYKSIEHVHNRIINETGGQSGIRDSGGLYASLYIILKFKYKNLNKPFHVAAFVYEELARKHHFFDGNKRTAHYYAKFTLILFGYHFKIKYKEALPFLLKIAEYQSKVKSNEIVDWIKTNSIIIEVDEIENYINNLIKIE